jgi:NAD(P)-dependent dehydrogenase (short-subunit alcohol dehydrogenase family)
MDMTAGAGRLQDKQVLVTGGTTGLGFAVAERFLHEGARVVVTGRDEELGSHAQAKLGAAGQVWFVAADAGDPAAVVRSVDVAVGHLGALDVLVNNAAIGIEAGLIRSNALCPGDTRPGMRHMAPPREEKQPENDDWPVPPIGRIGKASDVAAAATFYASDEAAFITGTTLLVDGGMTAGYHQREKIPLAEPRP